MAENINLCNGNVLPTSTALFDPNLLLYFKMYHFDRLCRIIGQCNAVLAAIVLENIKKHYENKYVGQIWFNKLQAYCNFANKLLVKYLRIFFHCQAGSLHISK